jgi:hypothetical protein
LIVYNVTINIDLTVHDEWMNWMKNIHIPDLMKTGMFIENRIYRVIGDEDSGGITYSLQYTCKSMEDLEKYQRIFAPVLQAEHNERYKDKFVAFRTLLEVVK